MINRLIFDKCRMCAADRQLNYLYLAENYKYVEYLSHRTRTQVHQQDEQSRVICQKCIVWLDGYYAMKKKHDMKQRTCQQHPQTAELNLVERDEYQQPPVDLDLQPLLQIPEEPGNLSYGPIKDSRTYRCAHCNHILPFKDKTTIAEHLRREHGIRCSRCRTHCPLISNVKYSKVTVYKNPMTNTVIAKTVMGTSGELRIQMTMQKTYSRIDKVLLLPIDDVTKYNNGTEVAVAYKCHTCSEEFPHSWTIEYHIIVDHIRASHNCPIHCKEYRQRQDIWVERAKNTKTQDARKEAHYVVGLCYNIDIDSNDSSNIDIDGNNSNAIDIDSSDSKTIDIDSKNSNTIDIDSKNSNTIDIDSNDSDNMDIDITNLP